MFLVANLNEKTDHYEPYLNNPWNFRKIDRHADKKSNFELCIKCFGSKYR
jgi:hypothetical protein